MEGESEECPAPGSDVLQEVCAQDDFAELSRLLKARERALLRLLADGFDERQCGLQLALSRQAVSKIRRHICRQAARLGITP